MRSFTATADTTPGPLVIELLDEIVEPLTGSLRPRGGQVLKFLGDGMLAIFPFDDATREQVCRQALDAAAEAMHAVDRLDFTVIGPAVNEAARIEALREPLCRNVLVSAELAGAVSDKRRPAPLGRHKLRGVREAREIYGLELG